MSTWIDGFRSLTTVATAVGGSAAAGLAVAAFAPATPILAAAGAAAGFIGTMLAVPRIDTDSSASESDRSDVVSDRNSSQ
jgi:hypothetical protein